MNPGPLGSALGCSLLSCALQEAIEARATDSKNLRGADAVAVAHFKDALDMDPANFIKRQRTPILFGGRDRAARLLQMSGEVSHVNEIGAGSEAGARDHVFEFADISGPIVLQQGDLCAAGETLEWLGIGFAVFFKEVLDQDGNVFRSFAQARYANLDGAEAVKEIFAESAGKHWARRSRLVAAIRRTSTCFTSGEPTR